MISETNGATATGQNGAAANGTATSATPRIKICVYCGASAGKSEAHLQMARDLAAAMAAINAELGEFTSM